MRKSLTIGAAVSAALLSSSLTAAELPVTISGDIEVEAFSSNDEITPATDPTAAQRTSDVVLAIVALALDAEFNDRVAAHVGFLYEDDGATPFDVDDATITVKLNDTFNITAGRAYLPFGNYGSHMVSDPLTLEMGEGINGTVMLGMQSGSFSGTVYAFNRDTEDLKLIPDNDDDKYAYGAAFGYAAENIEIGASYISTITESDGFKAVTDPLPVVLDTQVPGASAFVLLAFGNLSVIGEYVTATKEFHLNDFGGGVTLRQEQPSAGNLEVGYSFSDRFSGAVAYQKTDEAQFLGLPEKASSAALSYVINENATVSAEYAVINDYGLTDGGTDKDARVATIQLAVTF